MSGDNVNIQAQDQDEAEWQDLGIVLSLPVGSTDTILDIVEGDHIETSQSIVINKKGTTTPVLSKTITGSLLSEGVTIETTEP